MSLASEVYNATRSHTLYIRVADLEERAMKAEEALELGFDMLDVEHFPWCGSLDAMAALGANPNPPCNCGRAALSNTEDVKE